MQPRTGGSSLILIRALNSPEILFLIQGWTWSCVPNYPNCFLKRLVAEVMWPQQQKKVSMVLRVKAQAFQIALRSLSKTDWWRSDFIWLKELWLCINLLVTFGSFLLNVWKESLCLHYINLWLNPYFDLLNCLFYTWSGAQGWNLFWLCLGTG